MDRILWYANEIPAGWAITALPEGIHGDYLPYVATRYVLYWDNHLERVKNLFSRPVLVWIMGTNDQPISVTTP